MKVGWKTERLGLVCELISGQHIEAKDYNAEGRGVAYLTGPSDFGERTPVVTKWTEFPKRMAQSGDILITVKGSGVGKINLLDTEVAISRQLMAIRPHGINTEFLYSFLWTHFDHFQSISTGAAIPGISREDVLRLECPVPSPQEQQRIVAILDEAFDGITTARANAEKNLQNARGVFESQLESAFRLDQESFELMQLGNLCDRVSVGHVGSTSEYYCHQTEGVPFLRSQNVRRGYVNWDGLQYITKEFHLKLKKSRLHSGDLLFVRVGANRGDCCVVPKDVGEINCANIVFARPAKGNADYIQFFCESYSGRQQLLGMTTGSAQGVINTSSVAEFVIPIPPPASQQRIVCSLNEVQTELQRLESIYQQKLIALGDLKLSLLHRAFSGQL